MSKGTVWVLGALAVLCLAALALWLGGDLFWTSADKVRRDLELKAHETLMRIAKEKHPNRFGSDGCSGGLSRAWRAASGRFPALAEIHQDSPPWEHCCLSHDRAYHAAGGAENAAASYASRLAADKALAICVRETGRTRARGLAARYALSEPQVRALYNVLARAIFDAVRVGGLPCSGLSWRWGYGYPPCSTEPENP